MRHHKAIAVISLLGSILVFSQASTGQGTLVQIIDTSAFIPPSPDTAGVTWLQHTTAPNTILASDSEVNEIPTLFTGDNLFEIDYVPPALIRTGTTCTDPAAGTYTCEPTGLGYNPADKHVFVSDDSRDRIFEVDPGPDGFYGTADDPPVTSFRIDREGFGSNPGGSEDGEGVTYCPDDGKLYIADGVDREVYIVDPGANGIFDGAPPGQGGDDVVTQFDVFSIGMTDVEGIVCDLDHTVALGFSADHLYLAGEPDDTIFHVTTSGTLVRTFTILAAARTLAGLTLAPSSLGASDPNPDLLNLYIAERGRDNNSDPDENDGAIYEYSVTGLEAPGDPPTNNPPQVDAGGDQVITSTLPAVANLDGTVTDDGLPAPPALTTTWTQESGPPGVTFGDPGAVDTTTTLPAVGVYVLRLTADDSEFAPFDEVMITVQEPTGGISTAYISTAGTADAPGLHFKDEDIVAYDLSTGTWSMHFDGSDVGLGGSQDVNAFHIDADGSILLSVKVATTLPAVGLVEPSDIVRFIPTSTGDNTAGTFAMVLDGSDVELGDTQGERIDAIGILPDGRIVISTTGNFDALGVAARDEDLVAFNDTLLGPDTMGSWEFYFDGSDVELRAGSEDVNGTWVDDTNGDIYLTTRRQFSVTGASGDGFDIFVCTPGSVGPNTSCTYRFFWDPQANGLTGGSKVDGVSLSR